MKKRIMLISTVFALLLCSAAVFAAGGTSEDPLISLNYLKETFIPKLMGQAEDELDPLDNVYDQASADLKEKSDRYMAQASGNEDSGFLYSAGFYDSAFRRADTVTLPTGSGFILREGAAKVTHNGTVVDVTAGTLLTSGGKLTANHRYLVGEDTSAQFYLSSEAAIGAVEGYYTLSPSPLTSTMPFIDIAEDDWFHSAVTYAYDKGLFAGTSSNTFSPHMNITRGMVVTVLYQLAGRPDASSEIKFTDVPDNAFYATPVAWATVYGVTSGIGNNMFAPNENITREQLACMLYSYAHVAGLDVSTRGDLSRFSDRGRISAFAENAVSWAVGSGIISGTSATELSPSGPATRSQMAAMLRAFSALN